MRARGEVWRLTPGRRAKAAAVAVGLLAFFGLDVSARAESGNADDFLIVDCLLPAQIRQLGQSATFLAPRKAIKASAHDCALRGGEFTRGDAGGPAGLRMWLPAAQQGDPQAQTYVGEIFERGLAGQPDYAAAATWYKRAADQNFPQALIALGALVEQGLGTPKDPALAVKLFRRAAGMPDQLPGDAAPGPGSQNDALSTKVSEQQRQIEELQRQLKAREDDVSKDRARLKTLQDQSTKTQAQSQAAADAKAKALDKTLAERDRELAGTKSTVADLQARLAALAAQPAQPAVSPAELERMRAELAQSQAATGAQQREADKLRAELGAARQGAAGESAKTQQLSTALAERDRELDSAKKSTAELQTKLAAVDPDELAKLRRDLASAQGAMTAQQSNADKLRGELQTAQQAETASAAREADLKQKLAHEVADRQAAITAKDDEIKKLQAQVARLDAQPSPQERGSGGGAAPPINIPVDQFGHYHALVIGIDNYKFLPPLKTPVNDAKAVAQELRGDYRFQVEELYDADRYTILDALNKLRQTLTDTDNLLIYYAGHGVLDTVNQRGNWLPVDAQADNPANWISNIQITDMLNAMAARQILVVADSCYSGTLTRDVVTAIGRARSESERAEWYKIMIQKPSRVALTSGGLEPVADSGGSGDHSLFADLFLKALKANSGVVATQEVYQEIEPAVASRMNQRDMHQVPEYAPIKMAGHEAGDFVFVRPRATTAN